MLGNVWVTAPANKGYAFRNAREMANVLVGAEQLMDVAFRGAINSDPLGWDILKKLQ